MHNDFQVFINRFESELHQLFHIENNINNLSIERGLPEVIWKKIMKVNPLQVAIPKNYGGRGVNVKECLSVLSAASYEALPLSLTFGINMALFLEPLAKYGQDDIQKKVFNRFLRDQAMGGLMITEPDYGSDALNMKTFFEENEKDHYHIKGQKHWQGLTGKADFWIVAARQKVNADKLSRDVSFFVVDNTQPEQEIKVKHYFNNLGLYMIPYGLNYLNISVPKHQMLQPKRTGIKMMLDILHRSRMQFPGMGMGFIKRMLDEALTHCTQRKVGGKFLSELDSVQLQLSRIQASYTLCSGMCARSAAISGIEHELSGQGLEANSMKALVTDLMQEAAHICLQLSGAKGYKLDHIAGRGIVDSRPFQIFEGSNEMLYTHIAESVIKQMKKKKENNFYRFLSQASFSHLIAEQFKKDLLFDLPSGLVQRRLVNLGKVIARLVCAQHVFLIVEKGYRKDLFNSCIKHVKMDIKKLLSNWNIYNDAAPILDYTEESDWRSF